MAEDDKGWSEKGKSSGGGKRAPKRSASDQGSGSAESTETTAPTTPSRPSKRVSSDSKADSGTVVRARSEDVGARKVAKAAATAGQRDVSFVSRLGFPALIALICLMGIGVVFYAWTTREALATPSSADHWHAVYGVYDCTSTAEDKYVPPFLSQQDNSGIHSHGDGIIHIHPFLEASSGDRATLTHFMDEMGIDITPEAITLDSGVQLAAGSECADGSGTASVKVLHWDFDFQATADEPTDPVVITDGFRDIKFDNDREVYIFALAADDTDIPPPPADRFNTLNNVTAALDYNPTDLTPQDTGVVTVDDAEGLVPADTGVGASLPLPADGDAEDDAADE